MKRYEDGFRRRAAKAAGDKRLAAILQAVAERVSAARSLRLSELGDFESLRSHLNQIKERVLSAHDSYVNQLQEQVEATGGTFHLARTASEACQIVCEIARHIGAATAVKSKSMTSEEVGLNDALEAAGIAVVETDLGEYIIQLANERPSHIVVPAIHKTREEIGALFAEKLGTEPNDDPGALTAIARQALRKEFLSADLGVTGANALVADNGTVVLLENEGNIRLTTTLPRVHVALAGSDKIIPAMEDLPTLLKLLPRCATGQKMSAYVSLIRGPRRDGDGDGPDELHLILVDNGRGRLRGDPTLREALKCIRCGACINVCPVFQHIGGHAYGSVYPGPIGAMITMALACGDEGWLLPHACPLCGACTEVCSAGIPIHEILLTLRKTTAQLETPWAERALFRAWSALWSGSGGYRATIKTAAVGSWLLDQGQVLQRLPPPGHNWTKTRDLLAPALRPFRRLWHDRSRELPEANAQQVDGMASHEPVANEVARGGSLVKPVPTSRPGTQTAAASHRFTQEIRSLGGTVWCASDGQAARDRLRQILAAYRGGSLVRWDHPELQELGLDELAADAGVQVANRTRPAGACTLKELAAHAAVGVSATDYAVADSGTLVFKTGGGQERIITLLPPVQVAVVRQHKVVETIDELFAVLGRQGELDAAGFTFVTGPSRTADIEMIPVIGMHGPKELIVVLLEGWP